MNGTDEKGIELYEDEIQLGEDGVVIHHPLDYLYYHFKEPGREPVNLNELTFAGGNLTKGSILRDVKLFSLEFFGEPELYREEWADPLRAETLKRLTGQGRSWYISFVGDVTERLLLKDERRVPEELFAYLQNIEPEKVTILNSMKPYGFGYGSRERIFFEVPNQDIEWVVKNVWAEAWDGFNIEGYNFKSGNIELLKKWNSEPRDEFLFKKVVDETDLLFYTHPAEHRHFVFLTNKMSLADFEQKINLDELKMEVQNL